MANYTDLKCLVCGETFCENDDIVVCPVCGTPHHRECYKNIGHCVNLKWHEQNKIYNVDEEREKVEDEEFSRMQKEDEENRKNAPDINCPRCNAVNDSQAIFCNRCGAPLIKNTDGQASSQNFGRGFFIGPFPPFAMHNPDDEIESIKIWKLSSVIRENSFKFISQFKNMTTRKKKTSFNFAAFIFSPFYFFYRKMYSIGIVTLILSILFDIPATLLNFTNESLSKMMGMTVTFGLNLTTAQYNLLSNIAYFSTIAASVLSVLCGLFANYFYLKKCKKICKDIESVAKTNDEFIQLANKKGGVNKSIIIAFIVIYVIIIWVGTFFLMSPDIFGV